MKLDALIRDLLEARSFYADGDVEVSFRPATSFIATMPIVKVKFVGPHVVLCEDPES